MFMDDREPVSEPAPPDQIVVVDLSSCELLGQLPNAQKRFTFPLWTPSTMTIFTNTKLNDHSEWHEGNNRLFFDKYNRLPKCHPHITVEPNPSKSSSS